MFTFVSKFFKPNIEIVEKSADNELIKHLNHLANGTDGLFFYDFNLYYIDKYRKIQYLFYLPHHGIYIANQIDYTFDDLKNSTISKASNTKQSTTNFEDSESMIRQKLDDILSFNEIEYSRFIYMSELLESEYDNLDDSFKELLPIEKIIFSDTPPDAILQKLKSLLEYNKNTLPTKTISIALQSHLILPSKQQSEARLLDKEQINFINSDLGSEVITLYGKHNSGKSTAIISRALLELLQDRQKQILITTKTVLAADLLRKELVNILTCAAININLKNIQFIPSDELNEFINSKKHLELDTIYCDDSHLYDESILDLLRLSKPAKQSLVLVRKTSDSLIDKKVIELTNNYCDKIDTEHLKTDSETLLPMLLTKIHSKFFDDKKRSMIICKDQDTLNMCKNALDEYFGIKSQITDDSFSLQYHDFSNIFLTNLENTHGVHAPHVFYIAKAEDSDIGYIISRALESATIITYSDISNKE